MTTFENFTEAARKSVFYANYEANCSSWQKIELIHLLRGLFRQDPQLLVGILPAGTELQGCKKAIADEDPKSAGHRSASRAQPYSEECRKALATAADLATNMHSAVRTEHLLLAVLLEGKDTSAVAMLSKYGITEEAVLRKIKG